MILASCGSDNAGKTPPTPATEQADTSKTEVLERATSIFYAMPSPLEMTTLIKSAGGEFRKDLLHNPNLASSYQTTAKRSLLLGIYGADLSYSSVYGQQQDAVKFLAATKRIAENIGVHEAFSAQLIERANAHMSNRDSMLSIMTEMYWQTNSQLREESRDQIALLVMAGGWAEGMYIGTQLYNEAEPDPEIGKLLAEQKFTAMQMDEMFSEYEETDASLSETRVLFQPLIDRFLSLNMSQEEASSVSTDASTGITTIGGKKTIDYSPEDLKAIKEMTQVLRMKILEV